MKLLQEFGYQVHFIYYGMEGLSDEQQEQMSSCWDEFFYIDPQRAAPPPSLKDIYHIDDWFDRRIGELCAKLSKIYNYTSCITNYVWFSKALDYLPNNILKIIDTHDIFGDRHKVALAAGIEPTWFYTTPELEREGLDRADVVIAIQQEEASYFKQQTKAKVVEFGYVTPANYLPTTMSDTPLKVGYLGSGNPFNVQSIKQLHGHLDKAGIQNIDWHIAGAVCKELKDTKCFTIRGRVDSLEGFYEEMDLIINPMIGGTGLKIKSVEALSYGVPLIATVDAMIGIPTSHHYHQFNEITELVEYVSTREHSDLKQLALESRTCFSQYTAYHLTQIKAIIPPIK